MRWPFGWPYILGNDIYGQLRLIQERHKHSHIITGKLAKRPLTPSNSTGGVSRSPSYPQIQFLRIQIITPNCRQEAAESSLLRLLWQRRHQQWVTICSNRDSLGTSVASVEHVECHVEKAFYYALKEPQKLIKSGVCRLPIAFSFVLFAPCDCELLYDDNGRWCAIPNHIFVYGFENTHTRTWNDRRSVFGARNCKRTPCSRWPYRFTHNECVRAEENVHRMSLNLYQQIYVKWANRIEVVNHWRNMDPLIAIAFCPFCIFISINVSSQAATASAAMALHHFRADEYILHSFRDIEENIGRILCITMAYVSKGKAYNNS